VTVGGNHDLLRESLIAREVNWVSIEPIIDPRRAQVKIRNKHMPSEAMVTPLGDSSALIRFKEPQRAVTPGQAAVFYDGDLVLGGGWIE
jgi:tRNA-specific 2-thiouridylase